MTIQTTIPDPAGPILSAHEPGPLGAGAAPGPVRFDPLSTALSPQGVMERLAKQSKMGRMPGFKVREPSDQTGGRQGFSILVSGGIYDYDLVCALEPAGPGRADAGPTRVNFDLVLRRRTPMIALALLVLTVFPGMYLTDSMLKTYFEWYTIGTWWWYLPMTALMIPVMLKQFRDGKGLAAEEARQIIARLRAQLQAP